MSRAQSMLALQVGNAHRLERADLRRDVLANKVDWRTVILDPPACLGEMLLSEVLLMMVPGVRRTTVETFGRRGFHAGITLTVRARRASRMTREWTVAQAEPYAMRRRDTVRAQITPRTLIKGARKLA